MKRIETEEDFRDWAQRVNFCSDLKDKIALQDEFGHSSYTTINSLFVKAKDWKLLAFAVYKNQAHETFERLIMAKCRKLADEEMERVNEEIISEYNKLGKAKQVFEECKKGFFKKLTAVKERVATLETTVKFYQKVADKRLEKIEELHKMNKELELDAMKWRAFVKLIPSKEVM